MKPSTGAWWQSEAGYLSKSIYILAVAAICLSLLKPIPSVAGSGSETSGDVVMAVVPVAALALAYFKDDVEGEKQWLRNVLANQFLTSVARVGIDQTSFGARPNGHRYAFPSGHVAFAGSGASFLSERYGWRYGVPAWLMTAYVANNRVQSDHHHWRDVIVSGALAYGVGKLFVTPENATYLAPVIGPQFVGLRWERSW